VVKGVHKPEEVDLAQRLSGRRAGPGGKESGPTVASDNTALTSDGHTIQVNDMCQAILKDRQPMVPGVEARKAVELILAIYRSARTCKEVTLPLR
jgi:predicted dehydrogenase